MYTSTPSMLNYFCYNYACLQFDACNSVTGTIFTLFGEIVVVVRVVVAVVVGGNSARFR